MKAKVETTPTADHIYKYGQMVLSLGLLYKDWLDVCKIPDRDRGLRLLKVTAAVFKANNWQSKYAYECVRLLVHQISTLSLQEAHAEFYGLFVNTRGKINTHIPVDERMEWEVKEIKKHVKHMYSNKTEGNVFKRSRALSTIHEIGEKFDNVTKSGGSIKEALHRTD